MTLKDIEPILLEIAKETLGIETLETRNSDSLDFHDVAVWQLKTALREAYLAGMKAGGNIMVETIAEKLIPGLADLEKDYNR